MKKEKRSVILLVELLAVTLFLGIGTIMLSTIYTGTYKLARSTTELAVANRVICNMLELADSCYSMQEYKDRLKEEGKQVSLNTFNIGYNETGEFIDLCRERYIEITTNNEDGSDLINITCRCINIYEEVENQCILEISTKKYYGGTKNAD